MNNPFEAIDSRLSNIENLLLDIKHGANSLSPKPEQDQLLTIQEAAEILNLSVPTIYGLVSRSEIPVCKKSKRLYFSRQELMSWIKSGRKMTNDEIEAEANKHIGKGKK